MRRRYVLAVVMVAPLACVLMTTSSYAQQKSLKEQLVGAWTLVSSSTKLPDGSPAWGANPVGLLILTDSGRYSTQLTSNKSRFMAKKNSLEAIDVEDVAVAAPK